MVSTDTAPRVIGMPRTRTEVPHMLYRRLGRSGLRVSAYGLGTNAFGGRADEASSVAVIHHAVDHGVNLIDTANVYTGGNSERIIGKAVRDRRDRVVLATKCAIKVGDGPNDAGASRGHIMREVERSLARLGTDYIDLYQIHKWDDQAPLDETLRALDDLVRSGKVRYTGCSNYAAWQLCRALWISDRLGLGRYESVQPAYSPADRRIETELVPCCLAEGVGLIVYFPLAGGVLTGKYRPGSPPPQGSRALTQPQFAKELTDQNLHLAQDMAGLASEVGCTVAQLTLAWVMRRPGITSALVGATKVAQQEENLKAVGLQVPPEVLDRVTELSAAFVAF
jgi:aryl-alcohol dehydrogenase-like predicted oxidoreductase